MLRILDITAPDINNGNGIRVTLWVAGCTHKCKGCHNSWTWKYEQGKVLSKEFNNICNKLSEWLKKDYVEGLTISGGDPLDQSNQSLYELNSLLRWVKLNYPEKNIWLYTGYVYEELNKVQKEVLEYVDVLVDGPYKEELRDIAHCPFRGSTNQRILKLDEIK